MNLNTCALLSSVRKWTFISNRIYIRFSIFDTRFSVTVDLNNSHQSKPVWPFRLDEFQTKTFFSFGRIHVFHFDIKPFGWVSMGPESSVELQPFGR